MTARPFLRAAAAIAQALAAGTVAPPWLRLVTEAQSLFGSDACALLQLRGGALVPRATIGLSADTMGRRFPLPEHPRLNAIVQSAAMVRFPADSILPDPYDGLLLQPGTHLEVHDCLGVALRHETVVIGALTLDSLDPQRLSNVSREDLEDFAALTAGLLATHLRLMRQQDRLEHDHLVSQALMAEIKGDSDLIGPGPEMRAVLHEIDTVAPSDLSVLILGETGVGKELVARRLHMRSQRAATPMIHVNCAALPENLIESELFGHVRGAFSGATSDRRGRFELADGGTLFLDEVGELTLPAQAKLLRVLQSGEIQRVGSDHNLAVDVRIIAATNQDLAEAVKRGEFRSDLYHRLAVYPLRIPPLRDRPKDILPLAGHFLAQARARLRVRNFRLAKDVEAAFLSHDWPGNVRELEHLLSRAALKAAADTPQNGVVTIALEHLSLRGLRLTAPTADVRAPNDATEAAEGLRAATEDFQRRLIAAALARHSGNLAAAAKELKVDRGNLHRQRLRLGLSGKSTARAVSDS